MDRVLKQPLSRFDAKALPLNLYTADQVRALDRLAIEMIPIEGFDLMKRAGKSAFRCLLRHWPDIPSMSIFCGGGNNGGDGLIIAGLAAQKGLAIELVMLADPSSLRGEAAVAWQWLQDLNESSALKFTQWRSSMEIQGELVVDCLLGTGLAGDVRGDYAVAIEKINRSGKPVFAVDIPSGLCSDTGRVLGGAIDAQRTITFIGVKQGLLTGEAPNVVGELEYDSLGVPDDVLAQIPPSCCRAEWRELAKLLPQRKRVAHKGDFGRVLVVGGDHGMAGAALMAAEAVCRVGAGLVYAATRPDHVPAFVAHRPEVMVRGVELAQDIDAMLENADVIVIGPGLGREVWGQQLFQNVMQGNKPVVVDADGLNMLANQNVKPRDNWVLTPHPGEAARLLKCSVDAVERNRFQAVIEIQKQYGGTVILKGAGTLIATVNAENNVVVWLANTGNPGMASGGMGDVLSGILGGLLAQHAIDPAVVAPVAVVLHGEAANVGRSIVGEYSLLASDVLHALPELLKAV